MATIPIEMKPCPLCKSADDVICTEPIFELAYMQEMLDRNFAPIIGEKIKSVTITGARFLCCACGVSYYDITGRKDSEATVQDRRSMKAIKDTSMRQIIRPPGFQSSGAK